MSSSQHFTIIFPTSNPKLLLVDINNVNAAGFILGGWWFAHATGRRPGQCELQREAEALHCPDWLGEERPGWQENPMLNFFGLSSKEAGLQSEASGQICGHSSAFHHVQ